MFNVYIYNADRKSLTYPTIYPTVRWNQRRVEPIWIERLEGFVFPGDNLDISTIMATGDDIRHLARIYPARNYPFIAILITSDGVFELRRSSLAEDGATFREFKVPLDLMEGTYVTGTMFAEIKTAIAAMRWMEYRNIKLTNESLVETLVKVVGKEHLRGMRTVDVTHYQQLAKTKLAGDSDAKVQEQA